MSWKLRKRQLLNNLDKLKFEEESQVMVIENVFVKIDTFTFPIDFLA